MHNRQLTANPASCIQLLDVIAKAESKGNYNAYFGNPANTSIDFTKMSIAQVMEWQSSFANQGNVSSAVGRYQIISTTLSGLVRQYAIDTSRLFDRQMQDSLAIMLLKRRGVDDYVNKEISREQFAANIAKEWAGLPKIIGQQPEKSYYDSDGINKSLVSIDEVLEAIQPIDSI